MRYRKLGRTGLKISELGFGCAYLGTHVDDEQSLSVLNAAAERGITLFDTADIYGRGHSEELLGQAMRNWSRDEIVVISKTRGRTGTHPNAEGLSRKHILSSVEQSLRRLQTDYVDVYMAHWPDPETPLEETLKAFDELVRSGKVRYIGCSNFAARQIAKGLWVSDKHELARFECTELRYNLITRWAEHDILPLCCEEELGVLVYNPLAGGLLAGKYGKDSAPPEGSRFGRSDKVREVYLVRYWYERNLKAAEDLRKLAQEYGHTPAQVAIAWLLHNPSVTCSLLSTSTVDQLTQNLACLEIAMPPDERRACDQIWDTLLPQGWFLQMGDDMLANTDVWH